MTTLPGGGVFGRSARREVRNPVLSLPSARAIMALPIEQRRILGRLLREIAADRPAGAPAAGRRSSGIKKETPMPRDAAP